MKGLKPVLFLAVVLSLLLILTGCAAKAPPNGPGALNIAQFVLAQGAINVQYRQLLVATGGLHPYTWTITDGSLPPGLTVTTDGIISGTPTTLGMYNFTVKVTDSQSPTQAFASAPLNITINPDLSLASVPLANGTVDSAYNSTFSGADGVPPYSYTVAFGSLPDGLTLSTNAPMNGQPNGASILGTPTTAGVYTFTVQATDSAYTPETATAVFTITVVGRLQGNYVLSFSGFDNGQPFYLTGRLVADGNGNITSGILDQNGPGATISTNVPLMPSTYNLPSGTNFATMTLNSSLGAYQFNILVSTTTDSKLMMVTSDPNHTMYGSGLLKKQSVTTISGSSTNFSFGLFGNDANGDRYAGAGMFALSSALTVLGGAEDTNDNGTVSGEQFITGGSFANVDPLTGRGTATLTIGGNTYNYAFYTATAAELVAVETDAGGPRTLLDILAQQSAGVSGGFVLCKQGTTCQSVVQLDGIASGGVPEAEVGVVTVDGSGNIMRTDGLPGYYADQSVGGAPGSVSYASGTYSLDPTCGPISTACGRITVNLQGASNQPVWYLVTTGQAFVVGTDPEVSQGTLQGQTAYPYDLTSLLGSYLGGTMTPVNSSITNEIDVAGTPPPGGIWEMTYNDSGPTGYQFGFNLLGTYGLDPTYGVPLGRFAICAPNTAQYCTSFMYDPNNPPVSIVYIVGGGAVGATGGKTGLVGLNLGVPQSDGTAVVDPNPRLTVYGR